MSALSEGKAAALVRSEWLRVAAIAAAALALVMRCDHAWSFFYDEWGTIAYRRSGGVSAFFAPHNGHLQAVVILIYRLLFATVGIRHYWPYELVNVVLIVVAAAMTYVYARARVHPLVAVAAMLVVLLNGDAWQVLLWAINIGFVIPMITLIGCLLLFRRRGSVRVDVTIAVMLTIALASSGLGIAVLAGAMVLTLAAPARWKHLWTVAVPGALYLAWFVAVRPHLLPPANLRHAPGAIPTGDVGPFSAQLHVSALPGYLARSGAAAANAVVGARANTGYVAIIIVLVLVLVLVLVAVASRIRRRVSVELIAVAVALLTFWVTLALTRSDVASPTSGGASRYVYPSTIMLVLIIIEALAGVTWRLPVAVLVVAAALVSMLFSIRTLRLFQHDAHLAFPQQNARFRAVQCDPSAYSSDHLVDNAAAPGLTVGVYLRAVHALGSPPGQSCD